MQPKIVIPGDRLSTEEELASSSGTFLEDGYVYSYLVGKEKVVDGGAHVEATGKDVKTFARRMMALGTVTDDLRTVMFVKLDQLEVGNSRYVALKSGKILAKQDSRPTGRYGGGGRDRRGPPVRSEKPCGVGDIVLAFIMGEDKDTYSLGIGTPECGVVHAECEMCGHTLDYDRATHALRCNSCKHTEHKKVSALYENPKEIEKILTSPRTESE